jgi:phosphotransferase system enzyme I (PtsI)
VKNQILKSHLPDIIPLVNKIIKMDQPEKMTALLTKLND